MAYPPSIYPAACGRHGLRRTDGSVRILFVSDGGEQAASDGSCKRAMTAASGRRWLHAEQGSDSSCDAWLWADDWLRADAGGGFHGTHMGVPIGQGHDRRRARSPSSLQAGMSLN
ncbi:hypothetical protein ACLOJK_019652 [Asimina triloba]